MKKMILSSLFVVLGLFCVQANASNYYLDNESVDQMFAQAEQVDLMAMHSMSPMTTNSTSTSMLSAEEKDPVIAFVLAWVVGYLGIHRAYLGTSTGTLVAYILTLGGCGIVAFVDWVVLLIGLLNDDVSKYIDNPSFFMW
jgi:TM2 domain-containing membrane protein YozV